MYVWLFIDYRRYRMILTNERIREIKNGVRYGISRGEDILDLCDTVFAYYVALSDKDTQIQQLQQRGNYQESRANKAEYKIEKLQQELIVLKAMQKDDADRMDECMELRKKLEIAKESFKQVQHDIDGSECRDDLDGIKGYIDEALEKIVQEDNLNKNVYISENV
jgi:nitrogen-specific signal transduction histidine kinase